MAIFTDIKDFAEGLVRGFGLFIFERPGTGYGQHREFDAR